MENVRIGDTVYLNNQKDSVPFQVVGYTELDHIVRVAQVKDNGGLYSSKAIDISLIKNVRR